MAAERCARERRSGTRNVVVSIIGRLWLWLWAQELGLYIRLQPD